METKRPRPRPRRLDGSTRASVTPAANGHAVERLLSPPEPSDTSSPRDVTTTTTKRKRPRFLGDIDRRVILQRLEKGEKQADLAREFGVTRAAICHLNKNRDEILTRFDLLAKSPQGRQMIEQYVRAPLAASPLAVFNVRELSTPSVAVLLTRLRDATRSAPAVFASTADRLLTILIEEALVGFGTKAVGVQDMFGVHYDGKEYARAVVGLSVGDAGRPLLNVFAAMEPTAFCGFVDVTSERPRELERLDLPPGASAANVMLFLSAFEVLDEMAFILDAVDARGVPISQVCIVCVTTTSEAVAAFASRYPDAKVVAAAIDAPHLAGFAETYERVVRENRAV